MFSRGTIIAALCVVELAILGEAVVAVHPGYAASAPFQRPAAQVPGALVEGGPDVTFDAGAHPSVTVDIGYADLTIQTRTGSQIDVSVAKDPNPIFMHTRTPITARKDGETIRIATGQSSGFTTGDDRMVTLLVPPETQVTVVNGGDIRATGLRAESSFNSVGRGSVTIEDYNAPALHVTAGGRISLHQIAAANIFATSSDSRIEGSGLQVRGGAIQSDDRVTLGFATGSNALVSAATSDGHINVSGFPAGATVASARNSDDDSASQTLRVGDGSGRLDVHSEDGNINLIQEGS